VLAAAPIIVRRFKAVMWRAPRRIGQHDLILWAMLLPMHLYVRPKGSALKPLKCIRRASVLRPQQLEFIYPLDNGPFRIT